MRAPRHTRRTFVPVFLWTYLLTDPSVHVPKPPSTLHLSADPPKRMSAFTIVLYLSVLIMLSTVTRESEVLLENERSFSFIWRHYFKLHNKLYLHSCLSYKSTMDLKNLCILQSCYFLLQCARFNQKTASTSVFEK